MYLARTEAERDRGDGRERLRKMRAEKSSRCHKPRFDDFPPEDPISFFRQNTRRYELVREVEEEMERKRSLQLASFLS